MHEALAKRINDASGGYYMTVAVPNSDLERLVQHSMLPREVLEQIVSNIERQVAEKMKTGDLT